MGRVGPQESHLVDSNLPLSSADTTKRLEDKSRNNGKRRGGRLCNRKGGGICAILIKKKRRKENRYSFFMVIVVRFDANRREGGQMSVRQKPRIVTFICWKNRKDLFIRFQVEGGIVE